MFWGGFSFFGLILFYWVLFVGSEIFLRGGGFCFLLSLVVSVVVGCLWLILMFVILYWEMVLDCCVVGVLVYLWRLGWFGLLCWRRRVWIGIWWSCVDFVVCWDIISCISLGIGGGILLWCWVILVFYFFGLVWVLFFFWYWLYVGGLCWILVIFEVEKSIFCIVFCLGV